MFKAIPTISLDAKMIYDRLRRLDIGETVPYEELSTLVGRSVQTAAYAQLMTARRRALNADSMCFAAVLNVGIKRLSDIEIVATGENYTRRIRRTTTKALRTLASVADYGALPPEVKNRFNVAVSIQGAIAHSLKPAAMRRVESKVSEMNARLAVTQALAAFGG